VKSQLFVKLYLDEMIPSELARVLREYGHDVVTTQEVGMLGKDDSDQLEYASEHGRAILTFNIGDFTHLHRTWRQEGKHHAGIVVTPELEMRSFGQLLRLCLKLLDQATEDEIADRLCYLQEFA